MRIWSIRALILTGVVAAAAASSGAIASAVPRAATQQCKLLSDAEVGKAFGAPITSSTGTGDGKGSTAQITCSFRWGSPAQTLLTSSRTSDQTQFDIIKASQSGTTRPTPSPTQTPPTTAKGKRGTSSTTARPSTTTTTNPLRGNVTSVSGLGKNAIFATKTLQLTVLQGKRLVIMQYLPAGASPDPAAIKTKLAQLMKKALTRV
jgi:hypothetical protein